MPYVEIAWLARSLFDTQLVTSVVAREKVSESNRIGLVVGTLTFFDPGDKLDKITPFPFYRR